MSGYDTCASHPDGCVNYPEGDWCGNAVPPSGPAFSGLTATGYQGAGPMFAAVPVGEPWYDLAAQGTTTWVVEHPGGYPDGVPVEQADAAWERYAGWSAFLDRAQAEHIADCRGLGEITRWDGLTEHRDVTRHAQALNAEADATGARELAEIEASS